jgi:hypothetical protein
MTAEKKLGRPKVHAYLLPDEFSHAMALMKQRRISHVDFCRIIGITPSQVRRWKDNGAPKYAAVCISAVLFGLPPWGAKNYGASLN